MFRPTLPRQLHPFGWWTYALALAAAASMTTNPLLLMSIIAVACVVTFARRGDNPWAASFRMYLWLAVFIVAMRVGFRVLFGGGDGPTIILDLPAIPLPGWVQGITLLGPISLESLLAGLYDGLRLAAIVICVGAGNALANPKRLLASLPGAFYEFGTVLVVAVSALPQLGESLQRVLRARKLRRGPQPGSRRARLRAVETIIIPVLSDALERSLALAASMDVRGFGRSGGTTPRGRAASLALGLAATMLLSVWSFRLLARSPDLGVMGVPVISATLLVAGLTAAVAAMRISGATVRRTRYRPTRWSRDESAIVACGLIAAGVVAWVGSHADPLLLYPSTNPIMWPTLTPLLIVALAAGVLPAWLPTTVRTGGRRP